MDQYEDLITRVAKRWQEELDLDEYQLKILCVKQNIEKSLSKLTNEKEKRRQLEAKANRREEKHCQPKQLADVVESVTGALTLKCGLYSAQDFLFNLKILNHTREEINKEIENIVVTNNKEF